MQLIHKEKRLKRALAIGHLGSWELDFVTGTTIWSEEQCNIFGLSPTDCIQTYESWLSFVHPDDVARVMEISEDAEKLIKSCAFEYRIIRKDGLLKYIYCESHFEFNDDGKPVSVYGIAQDITDRKLIEEKLANANRLYAFISQINQTILHVTDEQKLFDEACRIAIDVGKFELAWIGLADEQDKKLELIAQCNATEADLELFFSMPYSDNGLIANTLLKGKFHAINDMNNTPMDSSWKEYIDGRGFRSAIVLPIKKSGNTCYTFNLFSSKTDFFNDEEIVLLEEAVSDISFALDNFEKEKRRKRVNDKLKHSELRLKQAQATAHLGSWELDFLTGVALWSEEALRIYGLKPEDYVQSYESWISFVHPDDMDGVMKAIMEGHATLSNSSFLHRIVRKDGTIRHIHSLSHFEFDKQGKPTGLYGVSHDLTEMKETQEAFGQSQANLHYIMDLIPQAIFAKDYDGKFVFVNKSFAALYGRIPKQLINKTISETMPGTNDPAYFLEQDRSVIDTGEIKIIPELQFTDHTGRNHVFHTTKVPYVIPGKNEKAILGIAQDITEQKQADSERTKMITEIIQRNKDLEQFSYIVSHNLRMPVANITGLTDLLRISAYNEEEGKLMMADLATSVKKLDNVIKDLNYVLQVKHQVNENKEVVKFSELLADIEVSIKNLFKNEDVTVIGDFSAINEMRTIKSYLHSIFFNLISNSIKYRQAGIKPVIEITSIKEKNKIGLIFKDNGLGIDLLKSGEQVFGLYKRFHSHTEGKGMGLYMVRTQVETLGGNITIDSEINNGTLFKIVFDNNLR